MVISATPYTIQSLLVFFLSIKLAICCNPNLSFSRSHSLLHTQTDTVVEDADLSLRAYLKGWRFLYLHDVECLSLE